MCLFFSFFISDTAAFLPKPRKHMAVWRSGRHNRQTVWCVAMISVPWRSAYHVAYQLHMLIYLNYVFITRHCASCKCAVSKEAALSTRQQHLLINSLPDCTSSSCRETFLPQHHRPHHEQVRCDINWSIHQCASFSITTVFIACILYMSMFYIDRI